MKGSRFGKRTGPSPMLFSVLVLLALAGTAFGSAGAGSAARATVPQSSYQSGLTNTPNPIDQSGNLAITGNVLGGKHFRGNIPYGSTTSFGAPLGSTSLDSFLRYSAVPEGYAGYPQNYSPFYSPTGTMTTTSPGYQGVFTAASPKIAGGLTQSRVDQAPDTMAITEFPRLQVWTDDRDTDTGSTVKESPRMSYWTAPTRPGEATNSISQEPGNLSVGRPPARLDDPLMTSEEYQHRLQQLLQDLDRVRTNASQIERKLSVDDGKRPPQPDGLPPAETTRDRTELLGDELREIVPDVETEDRGLRLYDPSARFESGLFAPPAKAREARPSVMGPGGNAAAGPSALQRGQEASRMAGVSSRLLDHGAREPADALAATLDRVSEYADRLRDASGSGMPAQDLRPEQNGTQVNSTQQPPEDSVRQTYENSGSLTQRQFDQYMAAAAMNMRQGRYDRAVESFSLASVYIPHDSRAHLGKSHALLAAGEYVGSALSLARAIELDAQYALKRVNLVEILGGPDLFVQRITNLEELAQGNEAPPLQFLLAYIYGQMDRPDEARIAVKAARKGVISSVVVEILSTAINQ